MTEKNKWVGGALFSMIAAQFAFAVYSTVSVAISPCVCPSTLFYSQADPGSSPVQQLPDINLDPFKFCVSQVSKLHELIFVNMGVAFGASSPSHLRFFDDPHGVATFRPIVDVLAFLIIFFAARKPRYSDMPSILDAILRDATLYFVVIFSGQILLDAFILFAPVGGLWFLHKWFATSCLSHEYIQETFSFAPGMQVLFLDAEDMFR